MNAQAYNFAGFKYLKKYILSRVLPVYLSCKDDKTGEALFLKDLTFNYDDDIVNALALISAECQNIKANRNSKSDFNKSTSNSHFM